MKLFVVQTRDADTTGAYGSYTRLVRAASAKAAALHLVRGEIEYTSIDLSPDEDVRDYLCMEPDITVIEISGDHPGEEGFVTGDAQEFDLDTLVNEIVPSRN